MATLIRLSVDVTLIHIHFSNPIRVRENLTLSSTRFSFCSMCHCYIDRPIQALFQSNCMREQLALLHRHTLRRCHTDFSNPNDYVCEGNLHCYTALSKWFQLCAWVTCATQLHIPKPIPRIRIIFYFPNNPKIPIQSTVHLCLRFEGPKCSGRAEIKHKNIFSCGKYIQKNHTFIPIRCYLYNGPINTKTSLFRSQRANCQNAIFA